MDPDGAVSAVLAPERAIGCVVYAATELEGPGVVRHLEGTRFSIGEPDRSRSARCLEFSEAMQAGGLKCPVEPELRNDIWIKLLGNISFNPISALARATMRQMCLHGGTRKVIEIDDDRDAGRSPRPSAAAPTSPSSGGWPAPNGSATTAPPRSRTWRRGKPLELDVLLAAVVELAEITGVAGADAAHRARHLGPARAEERGMRSAA